MEVFRNYDTLEKLMLQVAAVDYNVANLQRLGVANPGIKEALFEVIRERKENGETIRRPPRGGVIYEEVGESFEE